MAVALVTNRGLSLRGLLVGALGGACVILVGCAEQVRLKNDLLVDVRLSGCKRELKELEAGSEILYRPLHPCFVRDLATLEVLGCLRFPPEAFTEDFVTLVSSLVEGISEEDCVTMESY